MHLWFGKKEKEEPEKAVKTSPAVESTQPAKANEPQPVAKVGAAAEAPKAAEVKPAAEGGSSPVVLRTVKSVTNGSDSAPHAVSVAPPSAKVRVKPDSRALYAQLMNSLYDAVLVLDSRGRVIDSNGRVANVLGFSRDEAWDMPITNVITGMTQPMLDKLQTALKTSPHALISTRCFRKDGTHFAGEVGVCLCALMRGSSFVMTIRNTAQRQKTTDELGIVHAAFLASPTVEFICQPDGLFTIVNPAFLTMFRMSDTGQAKATRLTDLLPETTGAFLKAASGVRTVETVSLPQAAEGEPTTLSVALSPLLSGETVTAVAGSISVLAIKKAEEEVK